MATLIKSNGEKRNITPKSGKYFSLEELQFYVEGFIEIIYLSPYPYAGEKLMIINEEGKVRNLPLNLIATLMVLHEAKLEDYIVGDVVICTKDQIE